MRFVRSDTGRQTASGRSSGGVLARSAAVLRRLPPALCAARLFAVFLFLAPCFFFLAAIYATPPAWWAERGVTGTQPADDYAAANQGQLKHIAAQAAAEMDARLPGGAGTTISDLIAAWRAAPATGVTRDDYAAVNLGQLKTVAKPFYDRLAAAGYTGQPLASGQLYPWSNSATAADDYALANLGQVKYVFSFDLSGYSANPEDVDGDRLLDAWELNYFGDLTRGASDSPDLDGLNNLTEFVLGTNPLVADAAVSAANLGLVIHTPIE